MKPYAGATAPILFSMDILKKIFRKRPAKASKDHTRATTIHLPQEGDEGLKGLSRFIFHEVPIGLILLDAKMNILGVNSSSRSLLHLRQDEAFYIGRPIVEVLRVPALSKNNGIREGTQRLLFSHTTHLGTPVEIELVTQGRYTLLILKEVQEAEDELKALAEATHHLRTPLTSIRGYAETLLDQPQIPQAKKREFLELILKNSEILTQIVRNIMFLSRLKTEASSKDFVEFDLFSLAEEMASLFENCVIANQKGPFWCCGDPELTHMALYSIVENAVQYGGSQVPVTIDLGVEGGFVTITVKDKGPGIPIEAQAHIFRRFFRAKETKNLHPEGTGLGLSIAKEIAVIQGGDISIKSQWGKGTEVTLKLRRTCTGS